MTRMNATTWQGATLRRLIACAIAAALVPASAAQARLGDLDPAFDGDGIATPDVGAARFDALATRPDGRPLAAGWASPTGLDEPLVVQLTNSGAPDGSFGVSGAGITRLPEDFPRRARAVALDAAGRVLLAGDRGTGQPVPLVLRLTEAGALDTSFGDPFGNTIGEAHAIAPHAGGILVAGWRLLTPGVPQSAFLARQLESGAIDPGFGFRDPFPGVSRALAVAVMPDDRIVVAGWAIVNGVQRPALARLLPTGGADLGFGVRGTLVIDSLEGELRALAVDGAGTVTAAGVSGSRALVVRRDATGGGGFATLHDGAALNGLVPDGARSLVAGADGSGQLLLSSLDAAGTPEPALAWRSFPGAGEAFGAAAGPAGTVYTAGGAVQPFVSRHLPNAAPTAVLNGPAQVVVGAPAAFDAGGSSDPEGEPLRFEFDLDGDGTYEFDGGANPLALRSFPAPGGYTVGVRVSDPRGAAATATRAIAVVAAAAPVPQPVLGEQGVARPLRGIVRIRLPGTRRFVRLTELTAIPNGTEIDARKGRLFLSVLHDASGRLDGAKFFSGRFFFRQSDGPTPITRLRLSGGSFANCTAGSASVAVIASAQSREGKRKKRRVRKLWGDGRGRFRTRGRYGAATVRGTRWLTLDRCDGTKVRVVRGKVAVKDLARPNRRPKLLRAGQSTLVPHRPAG
jgi:uncharacterized delta-60 repeat protein